MICIVGQTGSGKTTIYKELVKYGYVPIVPITTRPKRDGECDGIDYFFTNNFLFSIQKLSNKLMAFSSFSLYNSRKIKYGLLKPSQEQINNGIVIVNPVWLKQIYRFFYKNGFENKLHVIEIKSPLIESIERLERRGDNREEIFRRISCDKKDYQKYDVPKYVNKSYENTNGDLDKVISKIIFDLKKGGI